MMTAEKAPMLRGELSYGEPLARYTSWRVGGAAKCLYRPAGRADLLVFLRSLSPEEPLLWLGLGSNLLVRDGGFPGTVIATSGRLNELRLAAAGRVSVEVGVSCARVARFAAAGGLGGAEFLAGIPGTFGGALAMNAGAFGGETWRLVVQVESVDRYGVTRVRQPVDYEIGYRQVTRPAGEWFLAALLQLAPGDAAEGQRLMRSLLDRRNASQPIGMPSGGSVFRNPPGGHAARLIEAAGLKGKRLGGAKVSEKHANFIVNSGGASATDIERLIHEVQDAVERHSGVRLEPEVHIVGEALQ